MSIENNATSDANFLDGKDWLSNVCITKHLTPTPAAGDITMIHETMLFHIVYQTVTIISVQPILFTYLSNTPVLHLNS